MNLFINIIYGNAVGEATTGIRVAAVKWWRHHQQVNSLYRSLRYRIMQFHRPAKLKLERDYILMFTLP